MKIEVIFSTSRAWNPFSELFKMIQGTDYSHVCIRVVLESGYTFFFESSHGRNRTTSADKWYKQSCAVGQYTLPALDAKEEDVLEWIISKTDDEKYGYLQVVGMGIARLFKLKRNVFASEKHYYVCSESVAEFLNKWYGKEIPVDRNLIEPVDVEDLMLIPWLHQEEKSALDLHSIDTSGGD